ncbi:MAG: CRISPR-associated endonuclease Cas2 [Leptospiraceae bacterium]|nr:CRISPR-associated endonuclease Cas2 [Leptospiraceae bacterium]
MLLISYDISDTKLRTKFSKYITKYGGRLQYSVYEIKNSERVLANIITEIEYNYSKKFGETDSIMIFKLSKTCEITKYGYAKNSDSDLIVF